MIYTERTNGKYVTNDESLITKIKEEVISNKISALFSDLEKVGISKEEIIDYMKGR